MSRERISSAGRKANSGEACRHRTRHHKPLHFRTILKRSELAIDSLRLLLQRSRVAGLGAVVVQAVATRSKAVASKAVAPLRASAAAAHAPTGSTLERTPGSERRPSSDSTAPKSSAGPPGRHVAHRNSGEFDTRDTSSLHALGSNHLWCPSSSPIPRPLNSSLWPSPPRHVQATNAALRTHGLSAPMAPAFGVSRPSV